MRLAGVIWAVTLLAAGAGSTMAEDTDQKTVSSHDLALGQAVFTSTCRSCHVEAAEGAPNLNDAAEWEQRLQQDLATLTRHAIEGHGRMPPKGGYTELLDTEVEAAVAYVINRSQQIVDTWKAEKDKTRCDPIDNPDACSNKDMEDVMTLHMLWLLMGSPGD